MENQEGTQESRTAPEATATEDARKDAASVSKHFPDSASARDTRSSPLIYLGMAAALILLGASIYGNWPALQGHWQAYWHPEGPSLAQTPPPRPAAIFDADKAALAEQEARAAAAAALAQKEAEAARLKAEEEARVAAAEAKAKAIAEAEKEKAKEEEQAKAAALLAKKREVEKARRAKEVALAKKREAKKQRLAKEAAALAKKREEEKRLAQLKAAEANVPPPAPPAPVATAAPSPEAAGAAPAAAPTTIPESDLAGLMFRFVRAYERGNVNQIEQLFASNAHTNDADGKRKIAEAYRKLFHVTEQREMTVSNINWWREGEAAWGQGNFEVTLTEKGGAKSTQYSGDITLKIEKAGSTPVITQLYHHYE